VSEWKIEWKIEEKQRWFEAAAKRFVHTQKERKKKK
jgi:hypothetical protein